MFKHAVHAMASAGRKAMEMADIDAAAIACGSRTRQTFGLFGTPEAFSVFRPNGPSTWSPDMETVPRRQSRLL